MKTVAAMIVFFASSLGVLAWAQKADVTADMIKAALQEADKATKDFEAKKKAAQPKSTESAPAAATEETDAEIPDPRIQAEAAKAKAHLKSFSGVVNVLRQSDRVEVVFKTGEVFLLPRGAKQHPIFKALQQSESTGSGASITYDDRSMVIESANAGAGGGEKSK